MATFYDKNTDYKALMDKAVAAGDTASAAFYESLRNAKIRGEGLSEKFPETHLYDMGAPNQLGVSTFGSYSLTDPITATRPTLMGLPMGDLYGINYDQDYIRNLLDDATATEYNAKRQEFAATERGYYDQLYGAQNTALDTIRANNSAAVASGASKGMAAAQQLAAVLGLQQESVGAATDLANQRNELMAQEAAAYSANANTALNTSNTLKQAIQNADLTKYGYDSQNYVGELDYNAALRATIGEIIQSQNAAAATMYNADRNLDGTRYAADASAKASSGSYGGYGGGYNYSYTNNTNNTNNSKTNSTYKTTAAEEKANQEGQGNSSKAVTTKSYNGKSYDYNKTTGVYVYNNKFYTSEAKVKAAIDADKKGQSGQKGQTIDAVTGAQPANEWRSTSYSGVTYNPTTKQYKYKGKTYSTLTAALSAKGVKLNT